MCGEKEDSSKLYSEENFPSEVKDKNPTKKQQNCYQWIGRSLFLGNPDIIIFQEKKPIDNLSKLCWEIKEDEFKEVFIFPQ